MKTLLLIASLLLSPAAFAEFSAASLAYENKEYVSAYHQFKKLALIGNKRAQTNLAIMHLNGEGTPTDLTEAFAWMTLAQDESNPEHEDTLNMMRSKFSEEQLLLAEDRATQLLEKYGTSTLISQLSPITLAENENSPSTSPQVEVIKRVQPRYPSRLARAGRRGWVSVEFDIHPDGTVHNPSVTDAYPDDAFNRVTIDAISQWRYKLTFAEGIKPRPHTVIQAFGFSLLDSGQFKIVYKQRLHAIKQLAVKGNARAQYLYSIAANVGSYVDKKDFIEQEEVNNWLFKSAQNGNPDAQYLLGRNILHGKGCKMEKQKGLFWIAESAGNGNDLAARMTYDLLSSDNYINHSDRTAEDWLKQSAIAGNPDSMIDWANYAALNDTANNNDLKTAREFLEESKDKRSKSIKWYLTSAELYKHANNSKKSKKEIKKANKVAYKLGRGPVLAYSND